MLVTAGGSPAEAARAATDRVPIVTLNGPNLVALGWAASYARPGGNITGTRSFTEGTSVKTVELLSDIVPTARRLALLANLSITSAAVRRQATAAAVAQRQLELLVVDVPTAADLEPGLERARGWGADVLVADYVIPLNVPVERLPELVRRARLPAAGWRPWTEAGMLLSYAPNIPALYRRGAWWVARILGGADPGELPLEQPETYEFVVNRAALADLRLSLPEHVAVQVTDWVG